MYECTFPKDRTEGEYRRFLRAIMLQFASHIVVRRVTDLILLPFWRWERETRIASRPDSLVLAQGSVSMGLFSHDLVTAESQPFINKHLTLEKPPWTVLLTEKSHWIWPHQIHFTETASGNVIRLHDSPTFDSCLKREHVCSQNMKNLVSLKSKWNHHSAD